MTIKSKQIKGLGRGHEIGYPTINLAVPSDVPFDEGIYATWVLIDGVTYKGALHYGSIPTFDLREKTMEVHLIGLDDETIPETLDMDIEIDIVERLRSVKKFEDIEELADQIASDIRKVNAILK